MYYIFAKGFCYTANENQREGVHQEAGPFAELLHAEKEAEKLAEQNHKMYFVMEVISKFEFVPQVIKQQIKKEKLRK